MKLNPSQRELISKHVAELLNEGFITIALPGCPYSSMLFLVPKKDDKGMMMDERPVIDYRWLNVHTDDEVFP
ncbi:hypothetical protein LPJ71_010940, partial [Coemansia sp. S17]